MKKIGEWFVNLWPFFVTILVISVPLTLLWYKPEKQIRKESEPLREFKDGIQHHLVWSLKGECYFVMPADSVTVYLIAVPDCNRK